jgi:hypothetical protein
MMGLHPCSVKEDYKAVLAQIEQLIFNGNYVEWGKQESICIGIPPSDNNRLKHLNCKLIGQRELGFTGHHSFQGILSTEY